MSADALLYWLSARGGGSWRQFKAVVEELHDISQDPDGDTDDQPFRAYQLRGNLESLAHAEFFAKGCEEGWRVSPPALATHPHRSGVRAILCGGRTPDLLQRIIQTSREHSCEVVTIAQAPAAIQISASQASVIADVARQTGIAMQSDAPLAILSHLAPLLATSQPSSAAIPDGGGWSIREFDTESLLWRTADRARVRTARHGLFEFQLYDRRRYLIRRMGTFVELPRAAAIYSCLRKHRRLLRHDPTAAVFSVPATCRPPRLMERALVLCSGSPATYGRDTGRLNYADVPPDIARRVAELLGQSLA